MKKSYRYKRLRYYKQKWSINTVQLTFSVPAASSSTFCVSSAAISENPSRNSVSGQSVSTASSILKCAHIKVKGVFNSGMIQGQSVLMALMYCPEGINPNITGASLNDIGSSIFYTHPEWIIGWTRMDYSDAAQRNEFSLTSRLKRNLNPGDSIRLVVYNINNSTGTASVVTLAATSSYCCRSN